MLVGGIRADGWRERGRDKRFSEEGVVVSPFYVELMLTSTGWIPNSARRLLGCLIDVLSGSWIYRVVLYNLLYSSRD